MCFQPLTQGDITGYQVYYNGTMMNANSSTTTLTLTAPSPSNGVFTGTVVVMVTAINRYGAGPASDPVTVVINGKYVHVYVHCRMFTVLFYICGYSSTSLSTAVFNSRDQKGNHGF